MARLLIFTVVSVYLLNGLTCLTVGVIILQVYEFFSGSYLRLHWYPFNIKS